MLIIISVLVLVAKILLLVSNSLRLTMPYVLMNGYKNRILKRKKKLNDCYRSQSGTVKEKKALTLPTLKFKNCFFFLKFIKEKKKTPHFQVDSINRRLCHQIVFPRIIVLFGKNFDCC